MKHMTCRSPDLQHFLGLFDLKGEAIHRFCLHLPPQFPGKQPATLTVVFVGEEAGAADVLKTYTFDIAGTSKDWKGLEIIKALFGLPKNLVSCTINVASESLPEVTATYEPVESNYTGVTVKHFDLVEVPDEQVR
jgi:hypothetical protein